MAKKEEQRRRRLSRRDFLRMAGYAAAGTIISACTPPTSEVIRETVVTEVEKEVTTVVEATVEVEKEITSTPQPTPTVRPGGWNVQWPPFDKYEPTKIFSQPRGTVTQDFVKGDSIEFHAGDRLTEERLGIRFTPKFIFSGGDEYRQKLNLGMAANDLPDFFSAPSFDFYGQMVQAGMLKDITDLWEANAPDFMKEFYAWNDGVLWEPLTIDGRIYGCPYIKVIGQDEKLLWYRTDWLDAIGADGPPETLDELHDYAVEFMEAQVAGEDRPTIGLPINKDLNTWICSTDPIFGAYGVMPGYWQLMDDGTVQNYSTMQGAKEALALLSQWYDEGILNAEFYTLDTGKSVEVINNGQAGMYFGPYWCPRWPNADATANAVASGFEDAGWEFGLIPEGPAGRGTQFTFPVSSALACASAQVSDEDYIAMLEGWAWSWRLRHPMFLWETKWHGFEGYSYDWTDESCTLIPEREDVGIPTGGGRPDVLIQQREYEYLEFLKEKYDADEPLDCYEAARVEATFYSEESGRFIQVRRAYDVAVEAVEEYAIGSAYNNAPTPTMIERSGDLDALQEAAFIDIIVGNQPIDYFDEFVEQWRASGGDQIAEEIAERLG